MNENQRRKVSTDLQKKLISHIAARKATDFRLHVSQLWVRLATEPEFRHLPNPEHEQNAYKVYCTFNSQLNPGRLSRTLIVRVLRKQGHNKYLTDDATIQKGREWVSFDDFLDTVVTDPYFCTPVGDPGYFELGRWYAKYKKTFRLMDLPTELRLAIYEFATGDDVYPVVKDEGQGNFTVSFGRGWIPNPPEARLRDTHGPDDEVPPPVTAILQLNKKTRQEAMGVMWGRKRLSFEHPDSLEELQNHSNLIPTTVLSHVGLNFDNFTYLRFFGVAADIHPRALVSIDGRGHILSKDFLPNLERLDIGFRSTRWEPLTSPWTVAAHTHLGVVNPWVRPWEDAFACQRVMTTMILSLALPHVLDLKEVKVEGYVKNSTVAEFHGALEAERGGERSGWGMTREDILGMDATTLPPRCICSTPCGFWGVKVLFDPGRQARQNGRPAEPVKSIFKKYKFDYDD